MATKPKPTPPDPPTDTPTTADIVKPEKDSNGNQWTVEGVPGGVHVSITTKTGRQSSVTAPTEDEARELLLKHIK